MKVLAKAATSYHWRGLRYVWEDGETPLEVPDALGAYLTKKRGEFWTEAIGLDAEFTPVELPADPRASVVGDPPPRSAMPEIGIAKAATVPDSPLTPEAHAEAARKFEGDEDDGGSENQG